MTPRSRHRRLRRSHHPGARGHRHRMGRRPRALAPPRPLRGTRLAPVALLPGSGLIWSLVLPERFQHLLAKARDRRLFRRRRIHERGPLEGSLEELHVLRAENESNFFPTTLHLHEISYAINESARTTEILDYLPKAN